MNKRYPTLQVNRKQIREHRYIMESHIGRKLSSNELVHHKNEDKHDNRIENLQIVTRSEHKKLHPEIGKKFEKKYFFSEKDLLDRYKTKTIKEIASEFNCSTGTIQRNIKKLKIRNKIVCLTCGEFAKYRRKQLCTKHYLQIWHKKS